MITVSPLNAVPGLMHEYGIRRVLGLLGPDIEHPDLGLGRQAAQGRRIPDPGVGWMGFLRADDEGIVAIKLEGVAGQRQRFVAGFDDGGAHCGGGEKEEDGKSGHHGGLER